MDEALGHARLYSVRTFQAVLLHVCKAGGGCWFLCFVQQAVKQQTKWNAKHNVMKVIMVVRLHTPAVHFSCLT